MATVTKNRPRMTARQREVWRFMMRYQAKHGCPPTFWEIGKEIDLGTASSVTGYVRALVMRGAVKEIAPIGAHRRYEAVPEPKENGHAAKVKA